MAKLKSIFCWLRVLCGPLCAYCVDVGNAIQLFSFPLHMRLYALQLHIACCKRPATLSSAPPHPPHTLCDGFFFHQPICMHDMCVCVCCCVCELSHLFAVSRSRVDVTVGAFFFPQIYPVIMPIERGLLCSNTL